MNAIIVEQGIIANFLCVLNFVCVNKIINISKLIAIFIYTLVLFLEFISIDKKLCTVE